MLNPENHRSLQVNLRKVFGTEQTAISPITKGWQRASGSEFSLSISSFPRQISALAVAIQSSTSHL